MDDRFQEWDDEQAFIGRLRNHGHGVDLGDTTREIRIERIRAAIVGACLDGRIIGRRSDGKTETYAAAFTRIFKRKFSNGKIHV